MIFIMSTKFWEKHKKALVQPKDYIIMDATDDDGAKMNEYSNTISEDQLAVPARLIHLMGDDDYESTIDLNKIRALEDEFFYGYTFRIHALAIMRTYLGYPEDDSPDKNIFVVIRHKAYKYWHKKYKKAFIKVFSDAETFLRTAGENSDWEKVKKDIEEDIGQSARAVLQQEIKKIEKKQEKEYKERKEKTKKKTGKKKHKWKLDGFGFEELSEF